MASLCISSLPTITTIIIKISHLNFLEELKIWYCFVFVYHVSFIYFYAHYFHVCKNEYIILAYIELHHFYSLNVHSF